MASGDKTYIADKVTQDEILSAVNEIKSNASRKSINYLNEIVNFMGNDVGFYECEADLSMLENKTHLSPSSGGHYEEEIESYFDSENNIVYFIYTLGDKGNVSSSYYYHQLYSLDLNTKNLSFRGLFKGLSEYYYFRDLKNFCVHNGYMYTIHNYDNCLYRAPIDNKTAVTNLTSLGKYSSWSARDLDDAILFPLNDRIIIAQTEWSSGRSNYHIDYYDISAGTFGRYEQTISSSREMSEYNWRVGDVVYYLNKTGSSGPVFYLYKADLSTLTFADVIFSKSDNELGLSDDWDFESFHHIGDYKMMLIKDNTENKKSLVLFNEEEYISHFVLSGIEIPNQGCDTFNIEPASALSDSNLPVIINKFIGIRYDDTKDKAYLQLSSYSVSEGDTLKKLYIEQGSTMFTDATNIVISGFDVMKNDGSNVFESEKSGLYSFIDVSYLSVLS